MKRIILLLAVLPLLFAGCASEEDNEPTQDELSGTCWFQDITIRESYTFWFGKNGKCTVEWKTGIGDPITFVGTYVYNKPNIIIYSPTKNEYARGPINAILRKSGKHLKIIRN
jgi:hypothetical protein